MAITAPVSLSKIIAEFAGPNNLKAYYRGGPYVPDTTANAAISTVATSLAISQFLGASAAPAFTPVTRIYSSGSGTDTAPAGATNVVIAVWGGGASGEGVSRYTTSGGYGGGAGGYSQSTYAIAGGQTLNYTVGGGGASAGIVINPGSASSVTSGTKAITTMTANGAGSTVGGTASGGNQLNTKGGNGGAGETTVGGSGGPGGTPVTGWNSSSAGAGGAGADGNTDTPGANMPGTAGSGGKVIFYYT